MNVMLACIDVMMNWYSDLFCCQWGTQQLRNHNRHCMCTVMKMKSLVLLLLECALSFQLQVAGSSCVELMPMQCS
jgi:hypothetical protein